MTRHRWFLLGLLAFAALLVVACGDDEDDTASVTTAPEGAAYPVTVIDLLDREVTIAARPERIVGLSPTAIELVYVGGGTVIGRNSSANFPAGVEQATDVGLVYQPSIETILSLNPDLIVADSVVHAQPQIRGALEELTVPVVFAGAESYDDVIAGLRLLGQVLDAASSMDAKIAEIETAAAEAKAALEGKNVSAVMMIADRDQTLYAAKANSYAGDIMQRIGVTNPAADQPDAGPFPGYTAVAPETLLQFDPTFILTVTPAPEPAPRLSTIIPQIPPFAGLTAVRSNHVIEMDLELFLQAPGPRLAEAFRALSKTIADGAGS